LKRRAEKSTQEKAARCAFFAGTSVFACLLSAQPPCKVVDGAAGMALAAHKRVKRRLLSFDSMSVRAILLRPGAHSLQEASMKARSIGFVLALVAAFFVARPSEAEAGVSISIGPHGFYVGPGYYGRYHYYRPYYPYYSQPRYYYPRYYYPRKYYKPHYSWKWRRKYYKKHRRW
jgi:hypothetical protein